MMSETNTKTEALRELTVSSRYCVRQLSFDVAVPYIRISGKWLNEAGFDIGQKFTVQHDGGRLILKPVGETLQQRDYEGK